MALVVMSSFCGQEKERKLSFRNPWMLKDYLRDDLSSCSSNGFRSFPRRQCCVAVRSIIEKELIRNGRTHDNTKKQRLLVRNRSISSTLQRASMAVINAVKLLPFNSPSKNTVDSGDGNRFLPRSFFWKKERSSSVVVVRKKKKDHHHDDEIQRWISSGVVGKEKYQPLDLSNDTTVTMTSVSNSSDGKSDSSWSDLTFTSDSLTCSSENDTVERREKMEEVEVVSRRVGVIAGEDSAEPAVAKENSWFNEEAEKEQSSPISVLDFPYNDEGGSSPFTISVSRLKGTKERLMKKLGRFECLAGLEPINLESLISSHEIEDRSPKHSILPCSTPSYILSSESEEEEEEDEEESHESKVEREAQQLLNITKARIPSKTTKFELLENILLDFFRENVTQKANESLLQAAEGWINGHYDTLILGWEVKDKRQAYIKDMEEGGWWPRDTKFEREEFAAKLGNEVMAHLIEELMVEFCSS